MSKLNRVFFATAILFILVNCSPSPKENWEVLFDGSSLEGWDTYLGAQRIQDDTTVYQPLGLNVDTSVFKIVNLEGEKCIKNIGTDLGRHFNPTRI